MKTLKLVTLFPVIAILGGCAVGQNDFTCSAGDENALCASSRTIYQATDGDLKTNDTITYVKDGERKQVTLSELNKLNKGDKGHVSGVSEISDHKAKSLRVPQSFSYDGDVLRKDVRVLRVWIAPFVDSKDNLHLSSMVYTDVAQRSWELGTVNPNQTSIATKAPTLNTLSSTQPSDKSSTKGKPEDNGKYEYSVPSKEKQKLQALFN